MSLMIKSTQIALVINWRKDSKIISSEDESCDTLHDNVTEKLETILPCLCCAIIIKAAKIIKAIIE